MNTSFTRLLACSLLASCCMLIRSVPARDFALLPPATSAVSASAASGHDDDVETRAPATDDAREHDSRRKTHVDNIVAIGHNAKLAEGERADAIVSVFGSSSSAGEVDDAVVSVFGDTRATGPVGDDALAVLGNVYVNSTVGGDVVAVLGNVELGPEAEIHGQVVVIGGVLVRDPNAVVHGDIENIFSADLGGFTRLRHWIDRCLLYGRPLAFASGLDWAWTLALGFLALYVFLALLFRDAVDQCVETFETSPGQSFIAALLTILLTPVVFILLCITVIGIAAIPLLVFALFCACLFGKAVVLASLGRRCTGTLTVAAHVRTAIAVLVGGLVVLLLYTVPIVGFIVFPLLGLLGLGVVMYTLLIAARTTRHARATVSPATTTAPQAPAPEVVAPGVAASGSAPASERMSASEKLSPAIEPGVDLLAAPRAGFWIRMGALLIDAILIAVLLGRHGGEPINMQLLVLAAYGAVMWKLKRSTIGGIICGLQVARLDGREIDWSTAIVRALGCFVSLAVAGLGFIWIAIDHEKQSWHDKIAGTVVVRAPRSPSLT
jgi:uncharacterized RDD family membrane protein YckC